MTGKLLADQTRALAALVNNGIIGDVVRQTVSERAKAIVNSASKELASLHPALERRFPIPEGVLDADHIEAAERLSSMFHIALSGDFLQESQTRFEEVARTDLARLQQANLAVQASSVEPLAEQTLECFRHYLDGQTFSTAVGEAAARAQVVRTRSVCMAQLDCCLSGEALRNATALVKAQLEELEGNFEAAHREAMNNRIEALLQNASACCARSSCNSLCCHRECQSMFAELSGAELQRAGLLFQEVTSATPHAAKSAHTNHNSLTHVRRWLTSLRKRRRTTLPGSRRDNSPRRRLPSGRSCDRL